MNWKEGGGGGVIRRKFGRRKDRYRCNRERQRKGKRRERMKSEEEMSTG